MRIHEVQNIALPNGTGILFHVHVHEEETTVLSTYKDHKQCDHVVSPHTQNLGKKDTYIKYIPSTREC